jgi:hypothetical protein
MPIRAMKTVSGKRSLRDLVDDARRINRMHIEQLTRDETRGPNLAGSNTTATARSRIKSSMKNSLGKDAGPRKLRLMRTIAVQISRDVTSTSCLSLIH